MSENGVRSDRDLIGGRGEMKMLLRGVAMALALIVVLADRFGGVVDELTRRLGVARFTMAGNSMGGAVDWAYPLDHSDRVERLVLVDAAGCPKQDRGGAMIFNLLNNPIGLKVLKDI